MARRNPTTPFPEAAHRYPGYAHDFAPGESHGQFSEEFNSWQKNRESPIAVDSPRGPNKNRDK